MLTWKKRNIRWITNHQKFVSSASSLHHTPMLRKPVMRKRVRNNWSKYSPNNNWNHWNDKYPLRCLRTFLTAATTPTSRQGESVFVSFGRLPSLQEERASGSSFFLQNGFFLIFKSAPPDVCTAQWCLPPLGVAKGWLTTPRTGRPEDLRNAPRRTVTTGRPLVGTPSSSRPCPPLIYWEVASIGSIQTAKSLRSQSSKLKFWPSRAVVSKDTSVCTSKLENGYFSREKQASVVPGLQGV